MEAFASCNCLQAELQGLPGPVPTWMQYPEHFSPLAHSTGEDPAETLSSPAKVGLAYFILKVSVQPTSALGSLSRSQAGFWASSELPQPRYGNLLVSCHISPREGKLSEIWLRGRSEPNSAHEAWHVLGAKRGWRTQKPSTICHHLPGLLPKATAGYSAPSTAASVHSYKARPQIWQPSCNLNIFLFWVARG